MNLNDLEENKVLKYFRRELLLRPKIILTLNWYELRE